MTQSKLFDNGNFQAYRESDGNVFFMFGEEYAFDCSDLIEFIEYLISAGIMVNRVEGSLSMESKI